VPINRGKRSLALDIRQAEGRDVILRLAKSSDVFIENFRFGKAASLGLDERSLRAARPDIIYASLTAFGARGPDHERPGYDALTQARTGIVSITGARKGYEGRTGISVMDMGSGIWLALGVLAALFERQRTQKGQRVDTSLFETGIMWMHYHLLIRQFTGIDPEPMGVKSPAFAPYGDFPTADGKILIGISSDRLFVRLCNAVNRPEWARDPRYATASERLRNREQLESELAAVFKTAPRASWLAQLDEHGVPSEAIQTVGQVLNDPQLAALGQLETVALPSETDEQPIAAQIPRLPVNFSETPARIGGPPPELGEHGWDILKEAGYDEQEISRLAESGVIWLPDRQRFVETANHGRKEQDD
ncbi:MAG TPA: CoA transferase, partial [Terriglobia bacterium]|nr:CoA transferase [Terriglobia bacterium]